MYTEKATVSPTFVIHNGKDNVIIHTEDIIQITSATPYVSIHLENKRYLHSETLKSMLEQLDDQVFIRVHKSAVVNLSKIRSFKSRLNGDYDLQMTDGTLVRLSRTYASEFKNTLRQGPQVSLPIHQDKTFYFHNLFQSIISPIHSHKNMTSYGLKKTKYFFLDSTDDIRFNILPRSDQKNIGGPCEGCEAIYEYQNKTLTP